MRHKVIDMIRNGHHITCLPATAVLEHLLRILIHGIDYACIFIIDDEELVLVLIALLDEADNIDSTSYTGHKLRYGVAFYDVAI